MKLLGVAVELEVDVFDDKCPDLVAEPVHVKVALRMQVSASARLRQHLTLPDAHAHLECHSRLDLLTEHRCNVLVEVCHYAHRKLRFNATAADKVIEGVRERDTDAIRPGQ